MSYNVRPYLDGDAEALHDLTLAAIKVVGLSGYAQEQVDAWSARHGSADRLRQRVLSGHEVFVAVNAEYAPVGYSLLEPDGHLDMLYCHPDHTRRGLADRVLRAAEDRAIELGLKHMYTEASELARAAFERAGYTVTHRRDFDIDGISIHNYAMEKTL